MKAARRGSLEIYNTLDLCLNRNINYHERSHSWYAWDFYQANQLEIKLNNSTQAFCFRLKLWPLLEIGETSNFFKQTHFGIKLEVSVHNSRNNLLL